MRKRVFPIFLVLCLLLCSAVPCFAETPEEIARIGHEVNPNRSNYFLYGVLILAAVVFVVLCLVFFFKRRH